MSVTAKRIASVGDPARSAYMDTAHEASVLQVQISRRLVQSDNIGTDGLTAKSGFFYHPPTQD